MLQCVPLCDAHESFPGHGSRTANEIPTALLYQTERIASIHALNSFQTTIP